MRIVEVLVVEHYHISFWYKCKVINPCLINNACSIDTVIVCHCYLGQSYISAPDSSRTPVSITYISDIDKWHSGVNLGNLGCVSPFFSGGMCDDDKNVPRVLDKNMVLNL